MHTHADFHEVCWIEGGLGVHEIAGNMMALKPGMLLLIRQDDVHEIRAADGRQVQIGNVAFPVEHWAALVRRYWVGQVDPLGKSPAAQRQYQLRPDALGDLQRMGEQMLADRDRSAAALDRFLLNVWHMLRSRTLAFDPGVPEWLAYAAAQVREQAWFSRGVEGFFELAGRCPEHVTRSARRHFECTPTELVNRARMEWSARQLAMTDRPIVEISMDCGINNLSHFYRLFREAYKISPRRYRLTHRGTV